MTVGDHINIHGSMISYNIVKNKIRFKYTWVHKNDQNVLYALSSNYLSDKRRGKIRQKPHPPVLLGGTARNVLQRVVEWGDGWMPNRIAAEDIRRGRHTLNELAEQAGRDPTSLEILAFGFSGQFRSRTAIEEVADAGANRVTIWLDQTAGDAALAEMDQIAR